MDEHKKLCKSCHDLDAYGIGDYCAIGARLHRDAVRAVYRMFPTYKEPFPDSPEMKDQ